MVSFFHKHGGGTGDFVLLWDGRDPKSRRHIEDELDVLNSGSTATEFSVHYTTDLTKRAVCGATCLRRSTLPGDWLDEGDRRQSECFRMLRPFNFARSGAHVWNHHVNIRLCRHQSHQSIEVRTGAQTKISILCTAAIVPSPRCRLLAAMVRRDPVRLSAKRSLSDIFEDEKTRRCVRPKTTDSGTRQTPPATPSRQREVRPTRSMPAMKVGGRSGVRPTRSKPPMKVGGRSGRPKAKADKPVREKKKKTTGKVDIHMRLQSTVDTEEHSAEHPNPKEFMHKCARCRFLVRRQAWQEVTATGVADSKVRLNWLGQRPRHMGGEWALGCLACSTLLSRSGGTSLQGHRLNTKWSRFEVRTLHQMQAESLKPLGFKG